MLTITTHWWGNKYPAEYLVRLDAGLKRHLKQPYRFICLAENPDEVPEGIERISINCQSLLRVRGCFARLELFDPNWQRHHGIDERLVSIDLDVVITGPLDALFLRPDPFVILQGANAKNPCPYNGSLWMLRAGYRPDIWSEFSLEAAAKTPVYVFPDDQGWFWAKIPNAAGWNVGPQSGIWSFAKNNWPKDDALPKDARLVCFPGWRDPSKFAHLDFIKKHWTA